MARLTGVGRSFRAGAGVGCAVLLTVAAAGQTKLSFEVASIRPAEEQPAQANIGVHISGSQLRISYLSLKDYVSRAFRVRDAQISAPDWLTQARFDIAAKLPDGASTEQVPEMLQTLLTERFDLKTHRESR